MRTTAGADRTSDPAPAVTLAPPSYRRTPVSTSMQPVVARRHTASVGASPLAKGAGHTVAHAAVSGSNTPQASRRPTKGKLMDKNIVLLVAGTFVVLFLKAILTRQRRPRNPLFTCGRCRKTTKHDRRTIGAWQTGKEKFFCGPCHRAWLATQPKPIAEPFARHAPRNDRSGCLGAMLLLAGVPAGLALAWLCR